MKNRKGYFDHNDLFGTGYDQIENMINGLTESEIYTLQQKHNIALQPTRTEDPFGWGASSE